MNREEAKGAKEEGRRKKEEGKRVYTNLCVYTWFRVFNGALWTLRNF
jgi:hypothetical protein